MCTPTQTGLLSLRLRTTPLRILSRRYRASLVLPFDHCPRRLSTRSQTGPRNHRNLGQNTSPGATKKRAYSEHGDRQEPTDKEAYDAARAELDPEAVAQYARQFFGDRLPENALTAAEFKVYERLYGTPLKWSDKRPHEISDTSEQEADVLTENQDGSLEALQEPEEDIYGPIAGAAEEAGHTAEEEAEDEYSRSGDEIRTHPFTRAGRSGTHPSTISIPKDTMAGPVSVMLADTVNKHLDQTAERVFGGPGLPYSTTTPLSSRTMPQKPVPLLSSHSRMTRIEADTYIAALWPGMYAACMSVLVEVRKRLGSSWLERLLAKEGGPSVLDAGAGGAGVMAWRDILRAEHARLHESTESANQSEGHKEERVPYGKATVLTASSALRQCASIALENTTFLPRLPDYLHVSNPDGQRKQFDVILAPYVLWSLEEDYLRRQYIDNLWAMLSPSGGLLVFIEKGVPRGFEVVAGARQHMLDHLFLKGRTADDFLLEDATQRSVPRDKAAIVAPCTTETKCPMLIVPGVSRQRKDYCHFTQRFERPAYMQRLLGATARNYTDVPFSYVAVQRGVEAVELGFEVDVPQSQRLLGVAATERAFDGYDVYDPDLAPLTPTSVYQPAVSVRAAPYPAERSTHESSIHEASTHEASIQRISTHSSKADTPEEHIRRDEQREEAMITPEPETRPPNPFSLPRLVFPPMKRHGHVILDVCTPSGTLERWTVPKSYGKQAYRDARKASWGDLWPLGAKLRVLKNVRAGLASKDDAALGSALGSSGQSVGGDGTGQRLGKRRKEDGARGRYKARLRRRDEKKARPDY